MQSITQKVGYSLTILAAVASFGVYAYAQTGPNGPMPRPPHDGFSEDASTSARVGLHGLPPRFGSSTDPRNGDGWQGTSTRPMIRFQPRGSSTPDMMGGMGAFTGTVTSVGSSSFTLEMRKGNFATTTLTVEVSSTTMFRKATTTASIADVIVGSNVLVQGRLATSTETVAALRVLLGIGGNRGAMKNDHPLPPPQPKGLLDKIRGFFGGGMFGQHGSDNQDSNGASVGMTASTTEVSQGFWGGFFHSLFGWM